MGLGFQAAFAWVGQPESWLIQFSGCLNAGANGKGSLKHLPAFLRLAGKPCAGKKYLQRRDVVFRLPFAYFLPFCLARLAACCGSSST
nr:hypothetical protein [uncultured Kingella sp.]